MSAVSQIGTIMNMMGISKDHLPGAANLPANAMPGAPSSSFDADLLSLSPMAGLLQQLTDMDTKDGEAGEVDLNGLVNLKQRADMMANMLKLKMNNFASNLAASMKDAGVNPNQDLSIKNDDGMSLLQEIPGKNALETQWKGNDKLQSQFKEIAQLAQLLDMVGQVGSGRAPSGRPHPLASHPAARYAAQAQPVEKRAEATFVYNMMSGGYSFE